MLLQTNASKKPENARLRLRPYAKGQTLDGGSPRHPSPCPLHLTCPETGSFLSVFKCKIFYHLLSYRIVAQRHVIIGCVKPPLRNRCDLYSVAGYSCKPRRLRPSKLPDMLLHARRWAALYRWHRIQAKSIIGDMLNCTRKSVHQSILNNYQAYITLLNFTTD